MRSKDFTKTLLLVALFGAQAVGTLAWAQKPSPIVQAEGQAITAVDLEAELSKAPADVRARFLENPDAMAQLATNLLLRRVLAREAELAGLDKTPLNEALIRMAKDHTLAELRLKQIDGKSVKTEAQLDKLLSDYYKAETKRFEVPEQVQISHILVAKGEGAKEKAEDLLKQLKAGADFSKLAKENSADPGSAQRGGDLGTFGRGKMVKPFEEAAFALKDKGQLSDLVETEFGFHILKLESRQEAGIKPFDEVKAEIRKEMIAKAGTDARIREGKRIMEKATADQSVLLQFIEAEKKKLR